MAKKKTQLKKSHALLISLLVLSIVFVCLFTPMYSIAPDKPANRNVKVSGIDVISALFNNEDSLSYEATIILKDNTGADTARAIKNSENYATLFYIYAFSFLLLLLASIITLVLLIYLATFDSAPRSFVKALRFMNMCNSFLFLLTVVLMVVFSATLSFTNTVGNIILFESVCKLGISFYFFLIALLASVSVSVFGIRQKK